MDSVQPSVQILERSIKNVKRSPPSFSPECLLRPWTIKVEESAAQCGTGVTLVWHDSSGVWCMGNIKYSSMFIRYIH